MPGVSLYGREEYSFGPYSENPRIYFSGKMVVSTAFSGHPVFTRSLSGGFKTSVQMRGQPEVVFGFTGYLRIDTSLKGDTQVFRNSKGTLPVSAALAGHVTVVHIRHMTGKLRVRTRLQGKPSMLYSFEAALGLSVEFKGSPHVGPFWEYDNPYRPYWGPIQRTSTVWNDAGPSETPWRPI
ncbi:hypothetical protein PQB35_gp46 [Ochrobactrum phage vB_OspP_OH]|uniref:Uncharacterized protein n=1 Tax=Ochrobactrum phage vB_OspP_OH TaxID=2712957 RepID=A0A6G6XXQ8_9CAUD|nr:hypothetical protein PQB35_gp46 [Ochrobactrum phage vB_OspP_OH]QIG66102.1 hypothetical protein phiOH_p46 [Ochrobactrum phage vB_OspP_OH]